MISAIVRVSGWLAGGAGVLSALYWLFLNTPESNALTLTASATLALAMVFVAGSTVNTALVSAQGGTAGHSIRTALRGVPWFVTAAIPAVLVWMIVTAADNWIAAHSGEISAWFIARFGWADVTVLFRAETWLSRWIRWVAVPVASLCLLSALLHDGFRAFATTIWIRRGWHWRMLALTTLVGFLLLKLPWRLTMWHPELPPTWVEVAIAGLRLGVVAVLGLLGSALLVCLTTRTDFSGVRRD